MTELAALSRRGRSACRYAFAPELSKGHRQWTGWPFNRQVWRGRSRIGAILSALLTLAAIGGPKRYLDSVVDITQVLPPPPTASDPRYEADRRTFVLTRPILASPRGKLAIRDVRYSVPDLMSDFSCAAGMDLSPTKAPATYNLLANADLDTQAANEAAKMKWKRLRPFQIDEGPACQSKRELAKSFDYPSGHAAHGWTIGLILADLLPDRAQRLLARARAYGESRIVCGAHNMSAVEASQLGVTVSLQRVRLTPRYAADFEAAKAELRRYASEGSLPPQAACPAEEALVERSILADLASSVPAGRRRQAPWDGR